MTTRMRALPLVLILTAGSHHASAQQFVCYTVQPGDTAAGVALRLTGNAQSRHRAWFQIVDPATSRVSPKSEYDVIAPGWQACIPREMFRSSLALSGSGAPVIVGAQSVRSTPPEGLAGIDLNFIWVFVIALPFTTLLAWLFTRRDADRRQAMVDRMNRFGNGFIREFERPLVRQPSSGHPIKSQLRLAPRRGRLKILLAPNDRRSYPNLSDHRKNLQYDVARVLDRLGDELFISGQPYAQGPWVVIPFQLKAGLKEEGVR